MISKQSAKYLNRFLTHLQQNYGGLQPHIQTLPQSEIIHRSNGTLLTSDLVRLMTHEATAIHISNFYSPDKAHDIGQELGNHVEQGGGGNWRVSTERGLESSDVWTCGEYVPFNVASSRNEVDEYFEGAQREMKSRRLKRIQESEESSCMHVPQLWPLDKLRLELDEAWPSGAGLAREGTKGGRAFGGGLPRIMMGPTRWQRGYIHVDELAPLSPSHGLFSANIYLQLPTDVEKDEGHFHIWPLAIQSKLDWYKNAITLSGLTAQDAVMQTKLRKELGEPHKIHVKPGDLVLLSVQRPHAAVGFKKGTRVSLQCFIQHKGLGERLLIDS